MIALLGIAVFIAIAWIVSENKKAVPWRFTAKALTLQAVLVFVFLKVPVVAAPFHLLNAGVQLLAEVSQESTSFLFGYLAGGATPYEIINADALFIIAFQVFPLILLVNAISNVLFHWNVIPTLIRWLALVLRKTLGISGPLGFGSAATIFLGTIEAPLTVKPYLASMNRSDLFALICCSMATISGSVMVLYAKTLEGLLAEPVMHLTIASLMSVPAALLLARVVIPAAKNEDPSPVDFSEVRSTYDNTMDALLKGISEGTMMVIGIVGTILVFFALIYLFNHLLGFFNSGLTLETILGFILRPFMFLTGISWHDSYEASKLMSTKIVLNEYVAYLELAKASSPLSAHSKLIMTYSMCGFANLASTGIITGGLTTIMPQRRKEISQLVWKSLFIGNLATWMTGAFAGFIY